MEHRRWRAVLPLASLGLASAGLWSALAPQPAPAETAASATHAPTSERPTTSVAPTTSATTSTSAPSTIAPTSPPRSARQESASRHKANPLPQLSEPAGVPADPRADVEVEALGRIRIPAIGLDHEIYEGIWLTVIDVGPGHWPGTPLPGGYGNVVFAGHRVTHSHPFLDVDQLVAGDEINFEMYDGTRVTYRVTEQFIVDPSALWIVDQAPGHTLTLFACHPKGSARQRIVIRAELVS